MGTTSTPIADEKGVLHRHADGTEHRHFRPGFTIGGQTIADQDGSEPHEHKSMDALSGEVKGSTGEVSA